MNSHSETTPKSGTAEDTNPKSKRARFVFLTVLCMAFICSIILVVYLLLPSSNMAEATEVPLIIDSDIGPWSDDFGALKVISHFVKEKKFKIISLMANNAYDGIVPLVDAVWTYYQLTPPNVKPTIGFTHDKNAHVFPGRFSIPEHILKTFPHPNFNKNSEAEEAVKLYRELLVKAKDNSLTIFSIGYLTNLANLLQSKGDSISPLSGIDLIKKKVKRTLVMAAAFPEGKETNVKDEPKGAKIFFDTYPNTMDIVGFDLGKQVNCGKELLDPVTNKTKIMSPFGLSVELSHVGLGDFDGCWDVLAAYILDVPEKNSYFTYEYGQVTVNVSDGSNKWTKSEKKTLQKRLMLANKEVAQTLEENIDKILYTKDPK